ncbi:MAG TPA: hypothetical protein VI076_04435 [Actinopolymorphaceae bacterium]
MNQNESTVDQENRVVLYTVQALLGLISEDIKAIAVESRPERVVLHFAVTHRTEELDEDISDILFELEALFSGESPELESEVYVGTPGDDWPGRRHRLLYWAKDDGTAITKCS